MGSLGRAKGSRCQEEGSLSSTQIKKKIPIVGRFFLFNALLISMNFQFNL